MIENRGYMSMNGNPQIITFRVRLDSELYRKYFAAQKEKGRFRELALNFMENYLPGNRRYAISSRLTVVLTEEEKTRFAKQLLKIVEVHDGVTYSCFRTTSQLNRAWKEDVCDQCDFSVMHGTLGWWWDFMPLGGRAAYELWDNYDGDIYGLVDGRPYGTELSAPDYVERIKVSSYDRMVENQYGERY